MRPDARYATAIELLDLILAGEPVERALTGWARSARYAGSRDRAAIRDIVFDSLRRRRSFGWLGGADTGRGIVLGMLVTEGTDPDEIFNGENYAPSSLTDAERASMRTDLADAPRAVRLDFPDFLEPELERSLGDKLESSMKVLQERGPIDLRVNLLKADIAAAEAALAEDGIETERHPSCATTLRVVGEGRGLANGRAYRRGLVELQDIASQIVAEFAAPKPGETVLDYCAGGGGKTLALAAIMANRGRLVAHDVNPARMKDIPARAERAGANIEIVDNRPPESLKSACDLVLVDAPCSGSGAWRRNPAEKWRLTPERLYMLNEAQQSAVSNAMRFVKPGGRLVYATCSILSRENGYLIRSIQSAFDHWQFGPQHTLLPGEPGDGFFYTEITLP